MTSKHHRRREPGKGSRGAEYADASTRSALGLLAALRPILADIVREVVASGVGDGYYSTTNPAPGTSARTHNEVCRSGAVAGAVKDGRSWRCRREDWLRARSRRPIAAMRLRLVQGDLSVDALADLAMNTGRRS